MALATLSLQRVSSIMRSSIRLSVSTAATTPPVALSSAAAAALLLRQSNERMSSVGQSRWHSNAFASTATTTETTSSHQESQSMLPSQTQKLFMWGTDSSGSLWKPVERRDEGMLDVPTEIVDWKSALQLLGDSSTNSSTEASIKRVTCGPTDTAILLTNGQCYVMGENKHGQLGLGHAKPVKDPTLLTLSDPEQDASESKQSLGIVDLALSASFAAYIDAKNGDLYTCGFGGSTLAGGIGCLGQGDVLSRHMPTRVESLVQDGCTVQQVACGESHLTVLTTEGEVLTSGAGSYGRLGNFDTVDQLYLEPVEILTPDSQIISIAGGKSFTLALDAHGTVYGWGRNHKGQLGTGLGLAVDMYAMQAVPEPIDGSDVLSNRHVVQIAAGHSHAACVADTGEVFYWGMALHLEPVRVDELLHTKIVHVSCGQDYTLALDEHGHLYSLGLGKTGVLGQGSVRRLNQPAILEGLGTMLTESSSSSGSTSAASTASDAPGASNHQNQRRRRVVLVSAGWKHAACVLVEDE